jgi:hypothetical protein
MECVQRARRVGLRRNGIGSHTRAFVFFGGVTAMILSDNFKSGTTKACFYGHNINRTYKEMARDRPDGAGARSNVVLAQSVALRLNSDMKAQVARGRTWSLNHQ